MLRKIVRLNPGACLVERGEAFGVRQPQLPLSVTHSGSAVMSDNHSRESETKSGSCGARTPRLRTLLQGHSVGENVASQKCRVKFENGRQAGTGR